jgi:hypothetical protein
MLVGRHRHFEIWNLENFDLAQGDRQSGGEGRSTTPENPAAYKNRNGGVVLQTTLSGGARVG